MSVSGFSAGSETPSVRRQRRLRNLLLNRQFQLKYSGYFSAIALFVGVSLGGVLWVTSEQVIEQSRASVSLGENMVRQGEDLIRESEKVNSVVRMSIVEAYADDPALLDMFQGEATRHDKMLGSGQRELEENRQWLMRYAIDIERKHHSVAAVLGSALLLFVTAIAVTGIWVTHKIAGPVYKMQRLLRALGRGHFRITARLRKGDDLSEVFDVFNEAAEQLRSRQQHELQEITTALSELRRSGASDEDDVAAATARLERLREGMATSLATIPPGV